MNAVEIIEEALHDLEHSKITCAEFDRIVEPFRECVPVKKGKWVEFVDDRWGASYYSCSECGKPPLKEERTNRRCLSNFCPNCGARMEE